MKTQVFSFVIIIPEDRIFTNSKRWSNTYISMVSSVDDKDPNLIEKHSEIKNKNKKKLEERNNKKLNYIDKLNKYLC